MADRNPQVVESSTTTSTTKVTRTIRRTSRSRSPSPSRSRSPSRRKSLNRSPSPHRYNTRNSQLSAEQSDVATGGCCVASCWSGCRSTFCECYKQIKPLVIDLVKCAAYITLAYVALTMCSFTKCNLRWPIVPSVSILYSEKVYLTSVASFLVTALAFCIPFGQVVNGVPTDRGTLSYLCNSPAALLSLLALDFGLYKYDPSLLDTSGKELQLLFSSLLVITIVAVCIQWQFASFGTIYNVPAGITVAYLAERRFTVAGYPAHYFSSAVLVFAMCLTSYALCRTLFKGSSSCATTCASRGLLILAVTWSLAHKNYTLPEKSCFINTAALVSVFAIVTVQLFFIYQHKECARASSLMILLVGVVTGVLIKQGYLVIPTKCPVNSLWYCFNSGCALDALFVLARGDWKTNFLGFKPVDFVRKALEGKQDPRYTLCSLSTLDVKFYCVRVGHLCPLIFCALSGLERYNAGTLTCPVSTVLAMTILYTSTKLICLEKAITSSSEIVEERCSAGLMLWNLCVQPTLTLLPLRYILSVPLDAVPHTCSYNMVLMVGTFLFGIALHAVSTLQGHYLLIGESHSLVKCLTTLAANGDEKIPVSGIWRFIRYPFITGDLMAVASIALYCGCDAPLLYLPLTVQLIRAISTIRSYNQISPSFYGVRAWNSYQEMVKFNIIPGIW